MRSSKVRNYLIKSGLGFILGGFLALWVGGVYAAVTLVYFNAISGDGEVFLLWETATELDNAGFYINRSQQEDSGYQRINPTIIPPRGDGITGAVYEYRDGNVTNGTTYWYKLESIDFSQQSQYYESVSVIAGMTATPTTSGTPALSPTATFTPSGSSTETPQSTTATSTPIVLATNTPQAGNPNPYPGAETPSTGGVLALDQPIGTESDIVPGNQQSTATLIPFPTVTIQFPETSTPDEPVETEEVITDESGSNEFDLSNYTRYWPIGLLLLVWGLIITWFLITRKHL